jgi:CBS domain
MTIASGSSGSVTLPIRTVHVIDRSGERRTHLSVFCPHHGRSILLERCAGCPHLRERVSVGGVLVQRCVPPLVESTGMAARVGALVTRAATCVRHDVTADDAHRLSAAALVPIVDAHDRYVGAFLPKTTGRGSHARPLPAIRERSTLVEAARVLVTTRMRRLAVVSEEGRVVGLIDDFALLLAVPRESEVTP